MRSQLLWADNKSLEIFVKIRHERAMRADRIASKIHEAFPDREHLEIVDESSQHAGRQGQESHFKILLIAPSFQGQSRVARQRFVQQLLQAEFESGLHALSLRLLTADEAKSLGVFRSPDCQGGKS